MECCWERIIVRKFQHDGERDVDVPSWEIVELLKKTIPLGNKKDGSMRILKRGLKFSLGGYGGKLQERHSMGNFLRDATKT